jgi:hypothetical protein
MIIVIGVKEGIVESASSVFHGNTDLADEILDMVKYDMTIKVIDAKSVTIGGKEPD